MSPDHSIHANTGASGQRSPPHEDSSAVGLGQGERRDDDVLRDLPVGVFVLHLEDPTDPKTFRIVDLNRAAADLAGTTIDNLRGNSLADFPNILETVLPHRFADVLQAGEPRDLGEISYGDEHIRPATFSIRAFPLFGNRVGVAVERVAVAGVSEQVVRDAEERFRLLVQGVVEYAIFELDTGGHITSWNAGAERLKGYRAEEIIGKHFSVFYPPEDLEAGKPGSNLAQAVDKGQSEDEGWRIRKDGSRFWANVVITALRNPDGALRGFVKLTRDVTERREKEEALRQAKEELELRVRQRTAALVRANEELRAEIEERQRVEEQLRALAARLQHVREEERTRIAREIHDEFGQACTALKMDFAFLARKITRRQMLLRGKAESAMQLVDNLIHSMRRMASELRPSTLDDLGLVAAIEWQAQEFESRTQISCRLTVPKEPVVSDQELSTALFRIFQETLTNVARHAQATRVHARLAVESGHVILEVRDNGKGFDQAQAKSHKSLGVLGMQERALLLGGRFTIEAFPDRGTAVTVCIPLPSPDSQGKPS